MSFNSDTFSSSEVKKQWYNLTVGKLCLELEAMSWERLIKDIPIMTAVMTVIECTREMGLRSVDKLIQAELKYANRGYDVNLSFGKCMMSVGDEKEKEKEEGSNQLKQPYICSLISLNWLTLLSSPPSQLMLPPLRFICIL